MADDRLADDACGAAGLPSAESRALAMQLKALAHPARLELVRRLSRSEHCCGGDLCDCLPLAQSTISQHMEMLRKAGLVDWRQQGTRSIYTLNRQAIRALSRLVADLPEPETARSGARGATAP